MDKYEFLGQPSLERPDLRPPKGWDLSVIAGLDTVRNHALSPDGSRIAFIWDRDDLSELYVMPSMGGWPQRLTNGRGPVISWDDELPAWSPDSRQIAFTQDGCVHIVSVDGGLPRKVNEFIPGTSSPVWMPDCKGMLLNISRSLDSSADDSLQLMLSRQDSTEISLLTNDPGGNSFDARFSPDGASAAFIFRPFADLKRFDLRLVEVSSKAVTTLCAAPSLSNHTPRWRPDGQEIAFLSQESGFYEIWLIEPSGFKPVGSEPSDSGLRQLTRLGCDLSEIAWSPDGRQIACTANRRGAVELLLVDASSGESEVLRSGTGVHTRPNWSPDGSFLTFEYQDAHHNNDIYRLDLADGNSIQLTGTTIPALASLALVTPQQVSYKSFDGLDIPAFLYSPANPNGAGLLYLHGGPSAQYMYEWDIFNQYLVASGYILLCPNYRGSTGYGRDYERLNDFDWGGGDVQDCLAAADFLAGLTGVDPTRLASVGPSYGAYLTNCLLSRDPKRRFACGVSLYGDSNLLTSWALCSLRLRQYTEAYLGNPAFNRDIYRKGSPVFQAADVDAPLLLLHGLLDDIVPPQGSEEWAQALRAAGKTYEYKTYADEPHGFLHASNRLDAWQRIERFLNWYLLPLKTDDRRPETG